MDDNNTFYLKSSDGDLIRLSKNAALLSEIFSNMLNEFDNEMSINDESCPLVVPIVNGVSLRHVITYLEYYYTNPMCEIPEPIPYGKCLSEVLQSDFYFQFINPLSFHELLALLGAADYLNISPLINLCCAKLSIILMNKTPGEVEQLLMQPSSNSIDSDKTVNTNKDISTNLMCTNELYNKNLIRSSIPYVPLSQDEKEMLWTNLKWSCK